MSIGVDAEIKAAKYRADDARHSAWVCRRDAEALREGRYRPDGIEDPQAHAAELEDRATAWDRTAEERDAHASGIRAAAREREDEERER